jgi:acetone carboxylase gamma subunit
MFAVCSETPAGAVTFAVRDKTEKLLTLHVLDKADTERLEYHLVLCANAGIEVRFEKPANPYPRYLVHHFTHADGRAPSGGSGRLFPINEGC